MRMKAVFFNQTFLMRRSKTVYWGKLFFSSKFVKNDFKGRRAGFYSSLGCIKVYQYTNLVYLWSRSTISLLSFFCIFMLNIQVKSVLELFFILSENAISIFAFILFYSSIFVFSFQKFHFHVYDAERYVYRSRLIIV